MTHHFRFTGRSAAFSLSLVLGFAAAVPARAVEEGGETYREAFAGKFLVGAALGRAVIEGRAPGVQGLAARQFNAVTAENDMKWENLQPEEGRFEFEVADALVDFAAANGMQVTGHVLLWHQQTPDWVFEDEHGDPVGREPLLERLETHIRTVAGRYRGRVHGWDVVNEALNEDGSLRDSAWLRILGPDYIAQAFRMAHEAAPEARLIYNDYNLYQPDKRAGAVRLVRELKAQGVPIHAVGMQAHYGLTHPEDMADVARSIEAFAASGVDVEITELDLAVLPFPEGSDRGADLDENFALQEKLDPYRAGLPEDVAALQAARYAELFGFFLDHADKVSRVTFWGVTDAGSWKNNWPMVGRTDYPLTFDRQGRPKPAFHAIIERVRAGN